MDNKQTKTKTKTTKKQPENNNNNNKKRQKKVIGYWSQAALGFASVLRDK